MYRIYFFFIWGLSFAQAQVVPADSLPIRFLSTITIQGSKAVDTLQLFLMANKAITTEEMLAKLQGVSLIRRGSYGQEPMIQGMTGGQVNVTIDGMKMFGACTDKMDPVSIYIEPQNLHAMTVQPGAQGSRLGSTVGGSLNMQLQEPEFSTNPFRGEFGLAYQHVSSGLNAYTKGNYSRANKAVNYSLNYRMAQNYRAGGGETVTYTQYEKLNLTLAGKWKTEQGLWSAALLADDGWDIGFAALPMDVGSAKARMVSIGYEHAQCHGFFSHWLTKVYANSVKHVMDDSQREDVLMHMDMPGESSTMGAFWEGKTQALGKHRLSFRNDFFYNTVLAEMIMYPEDGEPMYMQTWPSSARADLGFFVDDMYTINTTSKFKASLRWDAAGNFLKKGFGFDQAMVFNEVENASFQQAKSLSIGIRKQWKTFVWEWNAGYSDRLPSLSELYGFYLFNRNDGYDYIGNPNLETEKSISGDVACSLFLEGIEINLSGFYKDLHDYIYPTTRADLSAMTPGANGVRVYENSTLAQMWGGDLTLLATLTKRVQCMAALKWIEGKNAAGDPLPLLPPITANTILKFSMVPNTNLQVECDAAASQEKYNAEFGEDTTSAYAVYHLRMHHLFHKQGISIACGVENLLDKKYHAHLDWGNIPRPGRNIYLNFSYEF